MISQTRIVLFIMVAVTIAFLGMSNAAIYKWQDPEGNMHFTDDLTKVPPDYRDRIKVEDLPEEPVNVTPAPQASEPPSTPPSTKHNPKIYKAAVAILNRALEKSLESRYQNAQQMGDHLRLLAQKLDELKGKAQAQAQA